MVINIIILLIFVLSIIYTFKYKFCQFKFIKESKVALKNKTSKTAFLLSLGSHIGAGNILGVTSALVLGGPGVLFWMTICTIFTSIFALIENTLGIKYQVLIDNERRGGSPYYILKGLKNNKLAKIFSFVLVLSSAIFFLPIQVKGVTFSLMNLFNTNQYIILICLLFISFVFIFRGTNIIINIINKIVPIMTFIFLFICIYAFIIKIKYIDDVIKIILKDAFTIKSGLFSVIIIGLKRSLFSNEAGLGTSPSINSYSDNIPIKQGYLQVLTCFIDTIVMCVMLGIIILLYDIDLNVVDSNILSIKVFENIFPTYGNIIGNFLLFIFSFATIVSSYYSGETNILFNAINKTNSINTLKFYYKLLFIIGIYIGVFFDNNKIWNLVDCGLLFLGLANIYVIIRLDKEFETELFMKINPFFLY